MAYTDKQKAEAAALLAEGRSYRDVEEATGIDHTTVHRWRRDDATFRDAVTSARASLEDLASAVLSRSWGELLDRLADPEKRGEITPDVLARMGGTAAAQLVALKRIETPVTIDSTLTVVSPEELVERRHRLLQRIGLDVIAIDDQPN